MIDPANAAAALDRELNGEIEDEYDALCDYIADRCDACQAISS